MTLMTRELLSDAINQGNQFKYLFFWGHQPSADGSVTASCLSQWWVAPFEHEGCRYPTAEHYMMAGKARLFGDDEMLARILDSAHPHEAKKLGRKVRGFTQEAWLEHRSRIVIEGNLAKFRAHDDLRAWLLGTGDRVLVEASPVDRIWGIGLKGENPRALDPSQWRGHNLLGFALMSVRDQLREV